MEPTASSAHRLTALRFTAISRTTAQYVSIAPSIRTLSTDYLRNAALMARVTPVKLDITALLTVMVTLTAALMAQV